MNLITENGWFEKNKILKRYQWYIDPFCDTFVSFPLVESTAS